MRRPFSRSLLAATLLTGFVSTQTGWSQTESTSPSANGQTSPITIDHPGGPPATAEIDLSPGLFNDLFGITDAALQGVAEELVNFGRNADGNDRAAVEFSAEQMKTVQEVISIIKGSINGAQIRVYEDANVDPSATIAHYEKKIDAAGWDKVLRVAKNDDRIHVALRRQAGAIRGAFIIACDGADEMVIALVDCDLSPEKAKKLSSTVTATALKLGLAKELKKGFEELQRELGR